MDELVKIAEAAGITSDNDLKQRLMNGEGIGTVELGQRSAESLGIRGVPYFVINEEMAISGLKSPDELVNIFATL